MNTMMNIHGILVFLYQIRFGNIVCYPVYNIVPIFDNYASKIINQYDCIYKFVIAAFNAYYNFRKINSIEIRYEANYFSRLILCLSLLII